MFCWPRGEAHAGMVVAGRDPHPTPTPTPREAAGRTDFEALCSLCPRPLLHRHPLSFPQSLRPRALRLAQSLVRTGPSTHIVHDDLRPFGDFYCQVLLVSPWPQPAGPLPTLGSPSARLLGVNDQWPTPRKSPCLLVSELSWPACVGMAHMPSSAAFPMGPTPPWCRQVWQLQDQEKQHHLITLGDIYFF